MTTSAAPSPCLLPPHAVAAMRGRLPDVARDSVAAIVEEVPGYAHAFGGALGERISQQVELALRAFLASLHGQGPTGGDPRPASSAGAYELGRGEAHTGRSVESLLAAYRVGARVSWQGMSRVAVEEGASAEQMGRFAELVFAYIDALSAASVAGHTDQLARDDRARQRSLAQLASGVLTGEDTAVLAEAARRLGRTVPTTAALALVPDAATAHIASVLPPGAVSLIDLTGLVPSSLVAGASAIVLLDPTPEDARALRRALAASTAIGAGLTEPLARGRVPSAWGLSCRAASLRLDSALWAGAPAAARVDEPAERRVGLIEIDDILPALVVHADPEALGLLAERALAPLDGLAEDARARLAETLLTWLLLRGARERVAQALYVHPQTVRYRMSQVRALFGTALDDPARCAAITVALIGERSARRP